MMFIVKWLRKLRGYVRFSATGGFIERLLNLIARNRLTLWDMNKQGEIFYGCTLAKDYKQLARYAKKSGVRTRIVKRYGAPFKVHRYRKRLGILVGLILCFAFLMTMQRFIWIIDVAGNKEIPSQTILTVFEELGIKKGAFIPKIDFRQIENDAKIKLNGVSWLAVNRSGSKVTIEIREGTKAPDIAPDEKEPCNIIAKRTGQIKRMEVYDGQKMVELKDTVMKGDLIVSGIMEDKAGNVMLRHASAKVIAETTFTEEFCQPLKTTVKEYTGTVKNRYLLDMFGVKLPLYIATKMQGEYELSTSYQQLHLFGVQLPFGLYHNQHKQFVTKTTEYTDEQAETLLRQKAATYEKTELKDAKIIHREEEKIIRSGEKVLKITYICEEDIAQKEEIYVNTQKNLKK